MTTIDPDQERHRLAEVYAHQTDGELEQVAAQMSDLTELAREALRAELTRRDLYVGQLDEPAGEIGLDFRELVTVRSFWNLLEAEMAKGSLDAAGIESFLFDDNMIRLDWFNAAALGGIKLRVDPENVEAASRVLDDAAKELPAEDHDSQDQ
jgi:hypothetical protein